jgi:predicted Rossmann-fold nucleotide-binding protein
MQDLLHETDNAAQTRSQSYLLPVEDAAFLLRDWGIRSTIVVFGSARTPSPEQAAAASAAAISEQDHRRTALLTRQSARYEAARAFARIASERGGAFAPQRRWRDNVIATGGGGGVMEAANRGAHDAGAPSIGFNITLPAEQLPNPYSTPDLTFRFHYFADRKSVV